jgi:hypothetical protein
MPRYLHFPLLSESVLDKCGHKEEEVKEGKEGKGKEVPKILEEMRKMGNDR